MRVFLRAMTIPSHARGRRTPLDGICVVFHDRIEPAGSGLSRDNQ
jgi:hypothetical protein